MGGKRRAASPGDIGPYSRGRLWLEGHADVEVVLRKSEGRRARRSFIHDRLLTAGRIDRAEWDAAEDWWQNHALAAGARMDGRPEVPIRSHGAFGPTEIIVNAVTALRIAYQRVGPIRAAVLRATVCDGLPLRMAARQFIGSDGGRACREIEAVVIGALALLAGTRKPAPISESDDGADGRE